MRVRQLARQASVTPDTVRHYVRIGLLNPSRDPHNGYREFSPLDLTRLRFVRRARQLGFRLGEIRTIFSIAGAGDSPCSEAREIVARRIEETRTTVRELQALQRRLESASAAWARQPNRLPTADSICSLIENWNDDDEPQPQ